MGSRHVILFLAATLLRSSISFAQYTDQSALLNINTSVAASYNGNGLSFYDFNQDGWDDITIGRGTQTPVFLINNQGIYTPAPFSIPNLNAKQIQMIMWVDYDADGDLDLLITKMFALLELWQNDGSYNFTNVAAQAGLDQTEYYYTGAAFCDYDHDGDLDFYVGKFYHPLLGISPGKAPVFYLNNGNGTFVQYTVDAGLYLPQRPLFQPVFLDYDNDGWEDLYLITDRVFVENVLFRNNQNGTFTNVTAESGAGIMICSMTGTVGDYDNDQDLDIYITNSPPVGSKMLRNNGNSTFTEVAAAMGTNAIQIGWGSLWIDYNNDTWQDLFVSLTGGHPGYIGNHFYHNNNGTSFNNIGPEIGILNEVTESYVCAMGDVNNDGYYDILLNNKQGYVPKLYNSITGDNNYLSVSLKGIESNMQGIGSWIRCFAGGNEYVRFTLCGENLIGQNSDKYIFGLGQYEVVDSLVVEWNMGTRDVYYNVSINQHLQIIEGNSYYENLMPLSISEYLCEGGIVSLSIPYFEQVVWNQGSTGNIIEVDEPGTYWANITTASGLVVQTQPITVEEAPVLNISIISSNETCFGVNNGLIIINDIAGEIAMINWSNGSSESFIEGLSPGAYTYELQDQYGCTYFGGAFIEPAQEIISLILTNPVFCNGESTGTVQVLVFGGVFPHQIDWQGQNSTQLTAGEYSVIITDGAGCVKSYIYTITEPEEISTSISTQNIGVEGAFGSAIISVVGGIQPYTYTCSSGVVENNQISELPAGVHQISVMDSNNCVKESEFEIYDITSVRDYFRNNCTLYPNPAQQSFKIVDCNLPPIFSYSIFDARGVLKIHSENQQVTSVIDTNDLPSGLYFLRIQTESTPVSMPFVKAMD